MSSFKKRLDKAAQVHADMMSLINICKSNTGSLDLWGVYWDSFWELSKDFPFKVVWNDPDTSFEEDVMSRYNAIDEFMQSVYKAKEEVI